MNLSNIVEFLQQNPAIALAIALAPIAISAAIFILMKISEMREERVKREEEKMFHEREKTRAREKPADTKPTAEEKAFPKPKSEKDLNLEDLKNREQRLREREEKLKRKKMLELEGKKQSVERKHVSGIVKEERKVTDAIEEKKEKEQEMEEMKNNRQRLVKLIELAEDRYKDGLMSEKNFRAIMNGYQKELVETDVETAKLRGYNI